MRTPFVALPTLLISLLALGCGGVKPTGTTTTPPSPYTFAGDWGTRLPITVNPTSVPISEFVGTLSASNGVVTGGLTPIPNGLIIGAACTAPSLAPIPVSGTVDSSGNLTITLAVGGGTATLIASLATNVETEATGSYKIVGGTCAMPSTPMQIAQYAPLVGTYTGSFSVLNSSGQPIAGTTTAITAVLTQSGTPNANGQYPVTGSVTVSGACSATFTLSNSIVWGGVLEAFDSSGYYALGGLSDPAGLSGFAFFTSETSSVGCPFPYNQVFVGTLTHQ